MQDQCDGTPHDLTKERAIETFESNLPETELNKLFDDEDFYVSEKVELTVKPIPFTLMLVTFDFDMVNNNSDSITVVVTNKNNHTKTSTFVS